MPLFISLKNSLLMFLGGLLCAVLAAFLASLMLSGPKLGPHFDFLKTKKAPVVSREILIINTDEYIEGSDFFLALMTLTEFRASNLVMTGRLSPALSPVTVSETEIRRRFTDEYALVGSNIKNLFEGIRMGYVPPAQAPSLVERLVELTEQGRDRLITSLVDRDEDLIRSIAVFGNFQESYSRPQPDDDGILRRVKPLDADDDFIHPVYQLISGRYAESQIETIDNTKYLWLRSNDGSEMDILLDKGGNIITKGSSFIRRINIELFREYDEKGKAMLDAMAKAHEIGAFSKTLPEKIPLFTGEHAQTLLEELLNSPDSENRYAWITAREDYFNNLEDFFNSSAMQLLDNEYKDLIANTDISDTQRLAILTEDRDELNITFLFMRGIYEELSVIHKKFKDELNMSLCIMGPQLSAESSALLANTLITGSHVKPVNDRYVFFLSIAASFIVLIFIFLLRPLLLLIIGLILSILSTSVSGGIFILFSYWIDPIIILASSLTGVLVLFYCKCAYLNYRALSFRSAYKAAVPKNILQGLIKHGRPGLSEVNIAYAAVIAIRDVNLFTKEDREKSKDAVKIKRAFFTMAKRALFNAGAVIAGYEGDTIFACFGSPLELKPVLTTYKWTEDGQPVGTYHPVEKACALVKQLLKNEKITWRFGIDAGECSFSWSPESGFSVSGRPAVRARMLVSKTSRYKMRALVTNSVREKTGLDAIKAGVLYDDDDPFFEFN
ncbi:MAG: hypothetical protein FWD40_02180 [Treponema sp.]|nr:hypothetical protein [Treponema sp.]